MKRLSILLIVLCPLGLFAQTDSNATIPKKDPLIIKYLVSSDFTFTLGNLRSFTTINKGQLELEKPYLGSKIMAQYRYGIIDSTVNSNELTTSLLISIFPKYRVYGFVNGGFETSFLRGLTYRGYGGLGAGFKVVKTETHDFEPFINFLYEYNKYRDPIETIPDTNYILQTFRGVVGWTGLHRLVKKKLVIAHNFKYQQSLTVAQNFRFEGNITISYPIIKILAVKAGFTGSYENVVPAGRRSEDFIWTLGIALTNL
ncbi:MAG: DUF481 domain-containing protein [Candidatus Kuenenia stuttgartiensis]|nr:DUF481 domain-containing protein [Candidatus Kuenenia stuttgartiensis]MCZ2443732.1 DUF481 domain-containing protein [Flavobacteriales bacterium]